MDPQVQLPFPQLLNPEQQAQVDNVTSRGQQVYEGGRGIWDAIPAAARPWIFGFALGYFFRGRK